MHSRAEILEQVKAIQVLPSAASRALGMMQDAALDLDALCTEIECDPALTANVLRLANSAYFGYHCGIDTVRAAVVRLGTKRVFQLVITAAVAPQVQQAVRGYDLPPGGLWLHSLGMGIGAVELARAMSSRPNPSLFVAGLLADIGKIALGSFVEADAEEVMALAYEHGVSFDEAERRVLGIDHAEVGAALLRHWNLPAHLVDVVRWHHLPLYATSGRWMANLVHIADALCMTMGLATGVDGLNYTFSNQVEHELGLTARDEESVLALIYERSRSVADLFGEAA